MSLHLEPPPPPALPPPPTPPMITRRITLGDILQMIIVASSIVSAILSAGSWAQRIQDRLGIVEVAVSAIDQRLTPSMPLIITPLPSRR